MLEREAKFTGGVRGEAAVCWAEAPELGIYEVSKRSCGNNNAATPAVSSFSHQVIQATLLAAVDQAHQRFAAALVDQIETGSTPAVTTNGQKHEQIAARLVVAADGRGSARAKMGRLLGSRTANPSYIAGVLLVDVQGSAETVYFIFNPDLGMFVVLFPLLVNFASAPTLYTRRPLASFNVSDSWVEHPYRVAWV